MGSSVLQRKMFMRPPAKKAEGGILSLVEGEMEEGQDNFEDRRPDNIEIIANNLRGDIRSMDERYLELAQMVGEAAFDTPEEVLALMQPQLQQQMAQAQPPAANAPSPQGMQQVSQGVPSGAPPTPPGAPGTPMAPQQPSSGIESLVADQGAEAAPQQPMAQEPVQRSKGTPLKEAMAGGEGSFKTGQGLQINISGVGSQPLSAYRASPTIDFGDVSGVKLDAMPQTDFGLGLEGELDSFFEAGGDPNTLLAAIAADSPKKERSGGIDSLLEKKKDFGLAEGMALGAKGLQMAGYGRDAGDEAISQLSEMQRLQKIGGPWVRERQLGSPPTGELSDPYLSDVARNIPINDPREPKLGGGVRVPGGYPADDQWYSGENMSKTRPLTFDELQERMKVREAKYMGPKTRKFYETLRGMGIEPELFAPKIKKALETVKSLPGVGKVGKVISKVGPVDAGIAVSGSALGYELLKGDEAPKPGSGVVPTLPNLPDGSPSMANQIPPVAGSPLGSDIPGPVEIPRPADLTREERTDAPVVEVDLTKEPEPYRENAITGENVPPGDQIDAPTAGDVTKQPGESDEDFRARVLKRAALYKELLGEDEASRKAKAYFLLAEAGLALAGAKGRSFGERISVGLKGLPSALGKLASEKTQLDRAATSAAISAVEQEDRDAAKYASAYASALARANAQNLPRLQKIELSARTIMAQDPTLSQGQALTLAQGLVDGVYKNDEFGNLIGPAGDILSRGPGTRPTQAGQVGYIADDNPFLMMGKSEMPAFVTSDEIKQGRKERSETAKLLASIQSSMPLIEKTYGIGNVLTRAVTVSVTPFVGDIGPFSADKTQASNAIKLLQRNLRELLAVNESRISVYEQQQIDGLMSDVNSLLATPEIAIGQLQNLVRSLTNRINQIDHQLDPKTPLRQLDRVPLGTQNDPVPAQATRALDSFFQDRPSATIYVQRQDGKTFGLTREQWNKMQGQR